MAATWELLDAAAERRKMLRARGYAPLPAVGKAIPVQGWSGLAATDADIEGWAKQFPEALNTGVLARNTPAADIDITDAAAADAVEEMARDRFEERGHFLVRFGNAPKRLIPLRTDTPFKKMKLALVAPNGGKAEIEILGDGQQFIVDGVHPDTRQAYRWHGGELWTVPADDLPYVSEDIARQFLVDAGKLLTEQFGYVPVTAASGNGDSNADALLFDQLYAGGADWPKLVAHIHAGVELHDTLCSLSMSAVASGMNEGAAVRMLQALMADSTAPRDERWRARYDDIPRLVRSAVKKRGAATGGEHAEHAGAGESAIKATRFAWIDPVSIPARQFLYGKHLIRQFVSATIAHSGIGKSSLEITEALAMASNLPLLGVQPLGPLSVWYWNGEDPRAEIDRRVMAAAIHYDLTPDKIGRLFTDVGREMPIIIAEQTRDGAKIIIPVVDAVIKAVQNEQIDVIIIDPFVSSHRVTENDNNSIELVAKKWAHIADVTNSAIELVHHSRKTGADVTVQDSRGAVALLAAARSARVLNVMSDDEAAQAGVDSRKWYFRTDNGKANLVPPVDKAEWFKYVSVDLLNGDHVGVPTPWRFPNAFDGVTTAHLYEAQRAVATGGPWRENQQAKDWVGKPIARALKLNPERKADKKKISTLLKTWIATGMFVQVTEKDPKRRDPRTFIEVGEWATN